MRTDPPVGAQATARRHPSGGGERVEFGHKLDRMETEREERLPEEGMRAEG
jgi:hypothetical protein